MTQTDADFDPDDRPAKPAMWRGFRRVCPNCGEGPLFAGYLKVADCCEVCGQDFTAQRADDGPAYLTILLVGHLMIPIFHVTFTHFRPEPWVMATGFSLASLALSLYLLPRLKGLIVALQWAKRMHGFGQRPG